MTERHVLMSELLLALQEGRVQEIFGSGTACQVCPVHRILYQGEVRRVAETSLEGGHSWTLHVDPWCPWWGGLIFRVGGGG